MTKTEIEKFNDAVRLMADYARKARIAQNDGEFKFAIFCQKRAAWYFAEMERWRNTCQLLQLLN